MKDGFIFTRSFATAVNQAQCHLHATASQGNVSANRFLLDFSVINASMYFTAACLK